MNKEQLVDQLLAYFCQEDERFSFFPYQMIIVKKGNCYEAL